MIDMFEISKRGRVLNRGDIQDSYTNLAVNSKLDNYRIYTIEQLISGEKKIIRGRDVPEYLFDFIGERGKVLGIGNVIRGRVYSIKFKSLEDKKFLTVGVKRCLPYGLGGLCSDFKYGSWVTLVEGEKDRDSLSLVGDNVLSTSTAGAGSIMREVLLSLTNRFVLYYDNDDTGRKAVYREKKMLEKRGCEVLIGPYPDGCHDPGTIADLDFKMSSFEREFYMDVFRSFLNSI